MPGPSPSAHQVLVYSGPGVSPLSLSYTILTLSLQLLPHYTVQPVTVSTLSSEPWEPACALLVIPGGRDLPYVEELTMKTRVTRRIREFVDLGGRYLGICAGAYFGASEVRFDTGGGLEVSGSRDLAFFPGTCVGPTYPGFNYASESGAKAVSLHLDHPSTSKGRTLDHLYFNGGGHFIMPSEPLTGVEVIATYCDDGRSEPAAVLVDKGKGKALLCSVHFEYPLYDPPARDAIAKLEDPPDEEGLARSERERVAWVTELLILLGLSPTRRAEDGSPGEDPDLLLHPTHPSPVFVLSHPDLSDSSSHCFASLSDHMVAADGGWTRLRDGNDEIVIGPIDLASTRDETLVLFLANCRRAQPNLPEPINLAALSLTERAIAPPQPPDFHKIPKTFLLPSTAIPYDPSWTPLFNFSTYWSALDSARKRLGRKSGVLRSGKNALGDLVWYGETVTSTQTMLDRNPLLLAKLQPPLAFLASFQLTGRGRGSNIWLSPPGCLQFSLLLTLPQSLSSKMVFIQYLMALAVCEAVDENGKLGVRIKWPNDIYAETDGIAGTEVGGGVKGRAKLGGILVNTNFVNGEWRIVIGCGINILNALPTTSLSQLHSLYTTRAFASGKPLSLLDPPAMETTFARIMTAFETKWEQFIEEKGFSGFMDEYHGRWLHTNQEVTLTTTEPHMLLRVQSLTPDYGLLRCVPRTTSTAATSLYDRADHYDDDRGMTRQSAKEEKYVDLQPDGNSFDLMSGMIKRKV